MRIDVDQARKRAKELREGGALQTVFPTPSARSPGSSATPAGRRSCTRSSAPTVARFLRGGRSAPRPGARAARGRARAPRRPLGGAFARRRAGAAIDATAPGGPLGRPPLFYVARSRVAADTVAAATVLLDARRRPERAGRRGVDEPLDRLLARRCGARRSCCSTPAPSRTTTTRCTTRSSRATIAAPGSCSSTARSCPARTRSGTRSTSTGSSSVRLLLEHGGDPNESAHWPALHHAVTRGRGRRSSCGCSSRTAPTPRRATGNGRTALPARAYRRGRDDQVADVARARRAGRSERTGPRAARRRERRARAGHHARCRGPRRR